jgi:hypothetical protein
MTISRLVPSTCEGTDNDAEFSSAGTFGVHDSVFGSTLTGLKLVYATTAQAAQKSSYHGSNLSALSHSAIFSGALLVVALHGVYRAC